MAIETIYEDFLKVHKALFTTSRPLELESDGLFNLLLEWLWLEVDGLSIPLEAS